MAWCVVNVAFTEALPLSCLNQAWACITATFPSLKSLGHLSTATLLRHHALPCHTLLQDNIASNNIIFVCNQIRCKLAWGLVLKMMTALLVLRLEVIGHRSWQSRGVNSTLRTKIFT